MQSCLSCDGRCCRFFEVPLTDSDLKRLIAVGHKPEDFIEWVYVGSLNTQYPDVRLDTGYHYMMLRHVEEATCFFAENKNGSLRCSVYGSHPVNCRTYPYEKADQVRREYLCETVDPPPVSLRGLYRQNIDELMQYIKKVNWWNRNPQPSRRESDFLNYLISP